MRDLTKYKTPLVDTTMGLGRSLAIGGINDELWGQLDQIAKSMNMSKAVMLRPILEKYAEENLWRIQAKERATDLNEKSSQLYKSEESPPSGCPSVVPLKPTRSTTTSGVRSGAWIASLNAKGGRKRSEHSTGS